MKCPKCNNELVWGYTWIEHQGIGHPGPQTWFCNVCTYVEPIKFSEIEIFVYNDKH